MQWPLKFKNLRIAKELAPTDTPPLLEDVLKVPIAISHIQAQNLLIATNVALFGTPPDVTVSIGDCEANWTFFFITPDHFLPLVPSCMRLQLTDLPRCNLCSKETCTRTQLDMGLRAPKLAYCKGAGSNWHSTRSNRLHWRCKLYFPFHHTWLYPAAHDCNWQLMYPSTIAAQKISAQEHSSTWNSDRSWKLPLRYQSYFKHSHCLLQGSWLLLTLHQKSKASLEMQIALSSLLHLTVSSCTRLQLTALPRCNLHWKETCTITRLHIALRPQLDAAFEAPNTISSIQVQKLAYCKGAGSNWHSITSQRLHWRCQLYFLSHYTWLYSIARNCNWQFCPGVIFAQKRPAK